MRGRKCLSPSSERATILRGFRNRLLSSPVKSQQAVIYPDVNKPRPLLPSQRAGKTESPLARSCFILLFEEGVKGGESWEDFLKGGGETGRGRDERERPNVRRKQRAAQGDPELHDARTFLPLPNGVTPSGPEKWRWPLLGDPPAAQRLMGVTTWRCSLRLLLPRRGAAGTVTLLATVAAAIRLRNPLRRNSGGGG